MTTSLHAIDVIADVKAKVTIVRALLDFAYDAANDTVAQAAEKPRNSAREYDLEVTIYELSRQIKAIEAEITKALDLHDKEALL